MEVTDNMERLMPLEELFAFPKRMQHSRQGQKEKAPGLVRSQKEHGKHCPETIAVFHVQGRAGQMVYDQLI